MKSSHYTYRDSISIGGPGAHSVYTPSPLMLRPPLKLTMRLLRQCLHRFLGEYAAFEKAITHVVVKVGPLFSIVAYDVPDVLLGLFKNVRGLV